jgi:hypothetical protein
MSISSNFEPRMKSARSGIRPRKGVKAPVDGHRDQGMGGAGGETDCPESGGDGETDRPESGGGGKTTSPESETGEGTTTPAPGSLGVARRPESNGDGSRSIGTDPRT